MVISIDAGKAFDKIQYLFMIKTVGIKVIWWNVLNTIKDLKIKNIIAKL